MVGRGAEIRRLCRIYQIPRGAAVDIVNGRERNTDAAALKWKENDAVRQLSKVAGGYVSELQRFRIRDEIAKEAEMRISGKTGNVFKDAFPTFDTSALLRE